MAFGFPHPQVVFERTFGQTIKAPSKDILCNILRNGIDQLFALAESLLVEKRGSRTLA